jgi:hypothetical protein
MLVLPTPVSRAHCLLDFCGERVNCSNTLAEEAGLVAVRGLPALPLYTSHTVNGSQNYHECVQFLCMLEVQLHTHASIVTVLLLLSRISNITSKWSYAPRTTTTLQPLLLTVLPFNGETIIHLINTIFLSERPVTHCYSNSSSKSNR